MSRADIHRPSAIRPEEYAYVLSYSLATTCDGWPVPAVNVDAVMALRAAGARFAMTGGLGKCSVCGAAYVYGDVWQHEPTGEHVHVGHDCADKYQLIADRREYEREIGAARVRSAREHESAMRVERRAAYLAERPDIAAALQTDHAIVRDIAANLLHWGQLTSNQEALVLKLAAESTREEKPHVPAPVGEKRQTFRGTIVGAKLVESAYGTDVKITVEVETAGGSWLAYGTAPAGVREGVPYSVVMATWLASLRGATVEITTKLSPGRDLHFAFMNRALGPLA